VNRKNTEKKKSTNSIEKSVDGNDKKYAFTLYNPDIEDNVNDNRLFDSDAINYIQ